MTKVKSFIFHTGFAESQSFAALLLTNHKGFNSVQEALANIYDVLATVLKRTYDQEHDCCKETRREKPKAKFCLSCGAALQANNFEAEEVGQLFYQHIGRTCNDDEEDVWDALESAGWSHETKGFDWKNHFEIYSSEDLIVNAGIEENFRDYNVTCFNEKMSSQVFKKE